MEERDNRLFYGWSVVLGCAVVCGCNIGVLSNTVGVFLKPVSMELGVSRSQIALYSSIFSMVGMLAAPFQGRLMERYSLKKLMVSGAAVGEPACSAIPLPRVCGSFMQMPSCAAWYSDSQT